MTTLTPGMPFVAWMAHGTDSETAAEAPPVLKTLPDAGKESPLRVLLCVDSLGLGGKERQVVELVRGLSARPHLDVRVVCFSTDDFYVGQLAGIDAEIRFLPRRIRWDLGIFAQLRRVVWRFRPAVIHTNGLVSSFYALPVAKVNRIPVVNGSIRNAFTDTSVRGRLETLLLQLSDYRVANSRAGLHSRRLLETDTRNLVIYNGFDFSRVGRAEPDGIRRRPLVEPQTKKIGMVAEFSRLKDYASFIEAARILSTRRRDGLFITVGDGETLEACRTAARDLDAVTFLGRRHDVESIVGTFDIGVLSSFVEGLPNSIMEYMALGKPVVATEGGGTRELVVDGVTGLLVPSSNPIALAASIEYLMDNPEVADRMGTAGQARLRTEFSARRMIDETVALYSRAAGRFSENGPPT